ncbi:MAG: glycosyltransferase family 2 protein [Pseudomonas fluorescens]
MERKSSGVTDFIESLREASEQCTSAHTHIHRVSFPPSELLQHKFSPSQSDEHLATVTCCIAFGNDHPFLETALNSISNQTVPVQKICVGVDNSINGSNPYRALGGTLTEYRHFVGSHGPFVIMEQMIRDATTEYILLMDSDDIAHPDRLAILLSTARSTGSDFVGSASLQVTESGAQAIGADVFPMFPREALNRNICHAALYPTLLVRRAAFIELGGFATFESFGMDSEFVVRASRYHNFRNIPLPLYLKRDRSTSLTNDCVTGMVSERRKRILEFTCRRYEEIFNAS